MADPSDPLDPYIEAAAQALALPICAEWMPAIRANLTVTFKFAASVEAFKLPDEAEPAPVFTP